MSSLLLQALAFILIMHICILSTKGFSIPTARRLSSSIATRALAPSATEEHSEEVPGVLMIPTLTIPPLDEDVHYTTDS